MTARAFFPQTTFEQIAKICDWEPGYVIWPFRFWNWIMDRGIKVVEYNTLDYNLRVEIGIEGLRRSVPHKEFDFYLKNSKDLDSHTDDIRKAFKHPNFTFHRQTPSIPLLINAVSRADICEVVLNARALDGEKGFCLHRVVVLGFLDGNVVLHDPREDPLPKRRISAGVFRHAWLEALTEPELCVYSGAIAGE